MIDAVICLGNGLHVFSRSQASWCVHTKHEANFSCGAIQYEVKVVAQIGQKIHIYLCWALQIMRQEYAKFASVAQVENIPLEWKGFAGCLGRTKSVQGSSGGESQRVWRYKDLDSAVICSRLPAGGQLRVYFPNFWGEKVDLSSVSFAAEVLTSTVGCL